MDPIDEATLAELAITGRKVPASVGELDQLQRLAEQGYVEGTLGPPRSFKLSVRGRQFVEGKRKGKTPKGE